jgi:hypothetical protein
MVFLVHQVVVRHLAVLLGQEHLDKVMRGELVAPQRVLMAAAVVAVLVLLVVMALVQVAVLAVQVLQILFLVLL